VSSGKGGGGRRKAGEAGGVDGVVPLLLVLTVVV
jgi:hypothetical protein